MKILAGNKYLIKDDKTLTIDKIPIFDFLRKSDTPMMIFLEDKIRDNIKSFIEVFNSVFSNFECFYSFKANFLPEICEIVRSENIGAEVVGLPELNLALKVGFPPNNILVGGPYIPNDLIKKSIENEIKEIIIYNLNVLEKINECAKTHGIIQDICLRVNSTKYNSKLGVNLNESNIIKLIRIIKSCKNINFKTILSHFSTQMNNLDRFRINVDSIIKNLTILKNNEINIENINLGGGFPEATVMNQTQLEKIAIGIKKKLKEANILHEKIYFEPGRYFIGDAGIFLSKIVNVDDERWVFLNIGNHICPKFAKCSLRFYNVSQIDQPHKFETSFAGIVPTDQDVLAKNYFFTKELKEGDLVLVSNVGAYCITFSNRFPYSLPNIYLVRKEKIKQIYNNASGYDLSLK
ncbi:MAG: alanine racemase [Promethearchaeota archaeon]